MAWLARLLNARITQGSLTIVNSDGSRDHFGNRASDWPCVTLRLHKKSTSRRIFLNPALGLGEAFMDGSASIDDDAIMELAEVFNRNYPWETRKTSGFAATAIGFAESLTRSFHQFNTFAHSRSNVAHHYDLSNDFYQLWLGEDMQYSCAYWPDAQSANGGEAHSNLSLDEAQRAKLAHIAAKLALQDDMRILDIGCGWGGLALYLNRVANVRVHGITLSEEQFAFAQQRAQQAGVAERVTFELVDYRHLAVREQQGFDRIVSVGMFEHVGAPQFKQFFEACANLMHRDGVMLLHTIGRMGAPGATDIFTRKYIFPGGYIPAMSETVKTSEKSKLIVTDVENLRLHYAITLRRWYQHVRACREEIITRHSASFYRMWLFYLAGATSAFENGGMCNFQYQFVRDRRTLPLARDWMAETEKRYMAMG